MLLQKTTIIFAVMAAANCEWVQIPKLELPSVQLNPSKAAKEQSGFSNATIDPLYLSGLQAVHQQLRNSIWSDQKEPSTMQEKATYLQLLRNRILRHIAQKLTELNVSGKRTSRRRFAREPGWSAGSSSDIGFPSLEVALLTLSFLVFAVFLVNMVLVLFSNIFGSNTSTSTGTTGTALGRRRRNADGQLAEEDKNEQTARILKALEDFPLKHSNALNHHCDKEELAGCGNQDSQIPQIAQFLLNLKV